MKLPGTLPGFLYIWTNTKKNEFSFTPTVEQMEQVYIIRCHGTCGADFVYGIEPAVCVFAQYRNFLDNIHCF